VLRAIDRKLIRDLLRMKSQAIAISVVMSVGVATFIMALCTIISLRHAMDEYYESSRFAHVFAQLKRAPSSLEERIRAIEGVAAAETRVVQQVTLDIETLSEPAAGRLISLPARGEATLNRLYLRQGRYPERSSNHEVVANEVFTDSHHLTPGARIRAVINGRMQELTIVGIALSPEYIYQIRPGELMPDDLRYGIFWMNYEGLAEAFNMEGAFNDVALALLPGADAEGVIQRLDALLERYGSGGAYARSEQISHKYVSDELKQLAAMAIMAPSIFLGVASFLVSMVIGRMVRTQREQIAALKAFGYSNLSIAMHYLKFVVILAILGSIIGVALGWYLGRNMTAMYTQFFRFPRFGFILDARIVAGAVVLSAGMGMLGALGSARGAARLPPAEAMRPEPPPEYRPTLIERIGLQRLFGGTSRMILRKLESHPFRALATILGISLGAAVLILGSFSLDAVNEMMDFEFHRAQRQDLTVTLVEPTSAAAAYELGRLPGVLRSEPFRSVPVRIHSGPIERRIGITGLQQDPQLQRVLDKDGHAVSLPPEGLVISEKLAEVLRVGPGDRVTVEVLEGERPVRDVPVARTVAGYVGTAAYMDIAALNTLMREEGSISGAYLAVDPSMRQRLYRDLKETPRVAGVTLKEAAVESFQRTVAENILQMRAINVAFAVIIAVGVVYNTARITLAERARELASLRVLGFARREVSYILLGELAILVAVGIPLGLLLGRALAYFMIKSLATELYTIPLVVNASTYGFAVSVVVIASTVSGLIVRRSVDRLDLIAVLKNA
jgi:putative ABC transport system permease protein